MIRNIYKLLLPDDKAEGHVFISSFERTKIANICWTAIKRRRLKPTKIDTQHPKTKKKPQWDGQRGIITIKSDPTPARWVTHKLENNNTKEVLPLLWRFWTPHQASQPEDLTKGLEAPRESGLGGQCDLIIGFLQTRGNRDSSLGG